MKVKASVLIRLSCVARFYVFPPDEREREQISRLFDASFFFLCHDEDSFVPGFS